MKASNDSRFTLSAIIPTKGRADTLVGCVDSLAGQSVAIEEIIVVDQNPTPELEAILSERLIDTNTALVYCWRPDLSGLAQARNVGFDASTGEIVVFLDDDVVLDQRYLAAITEIYAVDSEKVVGGVGGWIVNGSRSSSWFKRWFLRGLLRDGRDAFRIDPTSYYRTNALSGCNMSFRRDAYANNRADESLRGYSMGEDWDLSARVSKSWDLVLTSNAMLMHNESPKARLSNANRLAMYVRNMHHFANTHAKSSISGQLLRVTSVAWFRVGIVLYSLSYILHGQRSVGMSMLGELLRQVGNRNASTV